MNRKIAMAVLCISMFTACVPAKKVEDIKRKKEICEEQRAILEEANRKLDENFTEVNEKYKDLLKNHKFQRFQNILKLPYPLIGLKLTLPLEILFQDFLKF